MNQTTVIIIIIVFILVIAAIKTILKFNKELKRDDEELDHQSIDSKFHILAKGINEYCYQGLGEIKISDQKNFNIYSQGSHQIVYFSYGAGILTIVWKIKYYHQEMVYKKDLPGNRNPTDEWQENVLKAVIAEFEEQFEAHVKKINERGL